MVFSIAFSNYWSSIQYHNNEKFWICLWDDFVWIPLSAWLSIWTVKLYAYDEKTLFKIRRYFYKSRDNTQEKELRVKKGIDIQSFNESQTMYEELTITDINVSFIVNEHTHWQLFSLCSVSNTCAHRQTYIQIQTYGHTAHTQHVRQCLPNLTISLFKSIWTPISFLSLLK